VAATGSIEVTRPSRHNAGPFQIPLLSQNPLSPNPLSPDLPRESSPMRAGALKANGARRRASNRIDRTYL
jgi:hypothetical protein